MARINRDVIVALVLLALCGTFISATFDIKITNYGTIQSSLWPRIVLGVLTALCLGLLAQAVRHPPATPKPEEGHPRGLRGWLASYRNAFLCYCLFFLFMLTLPVFGMLLGGILFVFLTLTALGAPTFRNIATHAIVSVISVGFMWALFTFGLRVFLPEGMLFSFQ